MKNKIKNRFKKALFAFFFPRIQFELEIFTAEMSLITTIKNKDMNTKLEMLLEEMTDLELINRARNQVRRLARTGGRSHAMKH